jgi:DNA modification methylase
MSNKYQIILGDCVQELSKIPDSSIDFILTDPPYGHEQNEKGDFCNRRYNIVRKGKKVWGGKTVTKERKSGGKTLENDGVEANDLYRKALVEFERVLFKGGVAAVCCGGGGGSTRDGFPFQPQFAWWSIWMDEVLKFDQMLIWDKGPVGFGWRYRRCYETVLVGHKVGEPMRWCSSSSREWNVLRPHETGIRREQTRDDNDHPTPKPVKLAKILLENHTRPGDTVLDPFCGAGWVGVACKEMNRNFIGMEIDPHWHKVATERIERTMPGLV